MKPVLTALAAIAAALPGASQSQPVAASAPVVVELFTSQGCSSCPPADALLGKLAGQPGVIVMSRPVTYWDNLGWKDTLAREGNTDLQRSYARRGGVGAGVYTPQAVVQGGAGAVGSREADLRRLIATAQHNQPARLAVAASADGGRTVLIDGAPGGEAKVWVVAMRSSSDVAIGRGENGGRHVRYVNVVVDEQPIAMWSGGKTMVAIKPAMLKVTGADRYAVVVQRTGAGPIVAAHYL